MLNLFLPFQILRNREIRLDVGTIVFQYSPCGTQKGVANGDDCFLLALPEQAPVSSLERRTFPACCSPGSLHQIRHQELCARPDMPASAFSRRTVIARTDPRPLAEFVPCLELAHMRSDFSQNACGGVLFDARYCLQQFVLPSIRLQRCIDL